MKAKAEMLNKLSIETPFSVPSVAICIPTKDLISPLFLKAVLDIVEFARHSDKYDISLSFVNAFNVDLARNKLAFDALKRQVDYIWFFDSDMIVEPSVLDVLFDMNTDIASALVFQKYPPYRPVITRFITEMEGEIITDIHGGGIIQVDDAGMGCVLIRTKIFESIEKPWFEIRWIKKPNEPFTQMAEDTSFYRKVKKAGFKVYVNLDLIIPHFGGVITSPNFLPLPDVNFSFRSKLSRRE